MPTTAPARSPPPPRPRPRPHTRPRPRPRARRLRDCHLRLQVLDIRRRPDDIKQLTAWMSLKDIPVALGGQCKGPPLDLTESNPAAAAAAQAAFRAADERGESMQSCIQVADSAADAVYARSR